MRTVEDVGQSLTDIVTAMNSISIEEIDAQVLEADKSEAIGPMLDPTLWAHGGMFEAARQTKKVMQSIREFKFAVSGIGHFRNVD